jgi:Yip1 domain
MQMFDVFLDPVALFKRVDERPHWFTPFIAVSLLTIFCTILLAPAIEQLTVAQLPEDVSAEMREQVLSSIKMSKYYGVFTIPLLILLKWSISAFILFGLAVVVGADLSYRKTLSVLAYSSVVAALEILLNTVVIYLRGLKNVQSPSDLQAIIASPAYFLSTNAPPALRVVLEGMSVFSLWYFFLLAVGLGMTSRLNKQEVALVTILLWVLQTGLLAGFALLFVPQTS